MKVDFKITTWERVDVPEEIIEEVIEKIKSKEIMTSNDLITLYEDKGVTLEGTIDEVEETMTPEENGGCSTIEVSECGDTAFFGNGEEF